MTSLCEQLEPRLDAAEADSARACSKSMRRDSLASAMQETIV